MADDEKDEKKVEKKEEKKDEKKSEQKKLSLEEYSNLVAANAPRNKGDFAFLNDQFKKGHLYQAVEKFKNGLDFAKLGIPANPDVQDEMKAACKKLQSTLREKQQVLVDGTSNYKEWEAACDQAGKDLGELFGKLKGKDDAEQKAIDKVKTDKLSALEKDVKQTAIKQEMEGLNRSVESHNDRMEKVRLGVEAAGDLKYRALSEAERKNYEDKKMTAQAREIFHRLNEPYKDEALLGNEDEMSLYGVNPEGLLIRQIRRLVEAMDQKQEEMFESSAYKGVKYYKDANGGIRTIPPGDHCANFGGAMDLLALGAGAQSFILKHPDPSKIQTTYGVTSIHNMLVMANEKGRPLQLDWKMTLRLHELRQERIDFHKEDMFFATAGRFLANKIADVGKYFGLVRQDTKLFEDPVIKKIDEILALQEKMKKAAKEQEKAEKRADKHEAKTDKLLSDVDRLKKEDAKSFLYDAKFAEKLEDAKKEIDASPLAEAKGGLGADPLAEVGKDVLKQEAFVRLTKQKLLETHPDAKSDNADNVLKTIEAQVDGLAKDLATVKKDQTGVEQQMIFLAELAKEHPRDAILHGNHIAKLQEMGRLLGLRANDIEAKAQAWQSALKDKHGLTSAKHEEPAKLLAEKTGGLLADAKAVREDNTKLQNSDMPAFQKKVADLTGAPSAPEAEVTTAPKLGGSST